MVLAFHWQYGDILLVIFFFTYYFVLSLKNKYTILYYYTTILLYYYTTTTILSPCCMDAARENSTTTWNQDLSLPFSHSHLSLPPRPQLLSTLSPQITLPLLNKKLIKTLIFDRDISSFSLSSPNPGYCSYVEGSLPFHREPHLPNGPPLPQGLSYPIFNCRSCTVLTQESI